MTRNLSFLFMFLLFTSGRLLLAETASGESAAGSLTSMPPAAPTLNSPADGATGIMSSDVTWNSVTHAASYNLQVATVSDFNPTHTDETGITATTYTVPGLAGGAQYFWHVSADNVAGAGDYSETWDFTTDASLPVTLSLFSAEAVPEGVRLTWVTESETDNLGFILERAEASKTGWQPLASYLTHAALKGQGNTSSQTHYTFTDAAALPGSLYRYRLSDVSIDGNVHIYDIIQITLTETPDFTTLDAPFPNPFNPRTRINYTLSKSDHVKISVYDLTGRKVTVLLDVFQSAGSYNVYWHGQNHSGRQLASGAYLIVLHTSNAVKKHKAVLLR